MAPLIYLVRHGQTEWNRDKRLQGLRDSPLTPLGRRQGRAVGRLLARAGTADAALQASPLGRARATAALIAAETGAGEALAVPALQEVALGAWEGLTLRDVRRDWPAAPDDAEIYFHAPGGESFEAVMARVAAWLDGLDGPVVAVTHSVVGRLIRGRLAGLGRRAMLALPAPQDGAWRLAPDGAQDFLPAAQSAFSTSMTSTS